MHIAGWSGRCCQNGNGKRCLRCASSSPHCSKICSGSPPLSHVVDHLHIKGVRVCWVYVLFWVCNVLLLCSVSLILATTCQGEAWQYVYFLFAYPISAAGRPRASSLQTALAPQQRQPWMSFWVDSSPSWGQMLWTTFHPMFLRSAVFKLSLAISSILTSKCPQWQAFLDIEW